MKVWIIQLKRIGDLILTSPVIHRLREAVPDAELTLISPSRNGLAEAMPADRHWTASDALTKGLLARPDWCFDFTGTDRSALITALAMPKRAATFERFRKKPLRKWVYSDFVVSSVRSQHTVSHHLDLLQPLCGERTNAPLLLTIPREAEEKASLLVKDLPPFAVIHAGTARVEKYWKADSWAEVAAYLQQKHGLSVVLTGSSDIEEQKHLETIKDRLAAPVTDLSTKTDLLTLAGVIKRAKLFLGVDTAAMHLADAMLTPTVALFGPTNPFHWHPRHTQNRVIRANTAQPFTEDQKGGPMSQITVGEVTAMASDLLEKAPQTA